MSKKEINIVSKFINGDKIAEEELKSLQNWLSNNLVVENFFRQEWEKEDLKETEIEFSGIQSRIREMETTKMQTPVLRKIINNYQKIAAILLLPLIAFSIHFAINQFQPEPTYFQTTAARGQKSQLVLPDGTKVWLNSDSQLKYPDNFGRRNRTVQLNGEAYFEVSTDVRNPFVVKAGEASIKVLGTKFNLKSYPAENEIETTLFEGKVEFTIQPENENISSRTVEMKPGESLIFRKNKKELKYAKFEREEILGWTKNQLIFRNDSFENLVQKIERWYDVDIVCDEATLNNQRLTVELYQGELLNRLLDIIELAMNVECVCEKDKIYIKQKKE